MNVENEVKRFLEGTKNDCQIFFDGETNKNPLTYAVGEEMIFKLKVKTDTCDVPVPFIHVKYAGDDGISSEEILPASSDGFFYAKTKILRDGFVRVTAKALDNDKKEIEGIDVFEGGAGADIDSIKICTPIPDDYSEYWKNLKDEAEQFPTEIIYEKLCDGNEDFIVKDLRFKTKYGKYLSLVVTYPKNALPNSLKLRMIFMGYGVNTAPLAYYHDSMSIGVNSHDVENFLTPSEYEKIKSQHFVNYGLSAEENKSPFTCYWHKMLFRDFQALSIFKAHPLLNQKDYIFSGGSQGGMQACHMAAHSGVATECYIDVPWCCDLWAAEKEHRMKGWRPDISEAMRYYDTAVAASNVRCPITITAGLGDYICPPSGQIAMYNGITAPKKLTFAQNRTHSYRQPFAKEYSL